MNIQNFLNFWSLNNDTIIKVLIALILFMIIYLAFHLFFGAATPAATTSSSVDTAQIEKTLLKILEAQGKSATVNVPIDSSNHGGSDILNAAGASSSASKGDLDNLRKDLAQKEILLQQARQEASNALSTAAANAAVRDASAKANSSVSKLETKIKDLEARLAEYEIISEDIADLSFYKEENVRLQTELTTHKTGSGSSERMSPENSGSLVQPEMNKTEKAIVNEPNPEIGSVVNLGISEPVAEALAGSSEAEDDLMKEFAQAVKDQKSTTGAEKPTTEANENSQLMNQFENFVKKS